jgi:tetratricopeptide (TPR) repeat protein
VRTFILISVISGLLGAACSHSPSKMESTAGKPPEGWPQKMQRLSAVLTDLMPFIANPKKFSAKENSEKIDRDTAELKSLSHALKIGEMPNNDPAMKVVSQLFDEDLDRALSALHSGNRDYARRILSDTTSYCIQCHTQTNNGPEFPKLSMDLQVKDLKPLDRAEFLAATRQFEPALDSFKRALSEPELASRDSFAYEAAAREALGISVRVHKDPKEALTIIKSIEKNKALKAPFKKSVSSWRRTLEAWRKEKPAKGLKTPLQELGEAEALIENAKKAASDPLENSQDLVYERASGLLHDLLQRPERTDELSARALYLSGIASEATRDSSFWTMHETYYEQCIRLRPETEQARQCFAKLKDAIEAGYSGSSGTRVPPEVEKRLQNFKVLAFGEQ